MKALSIHPYYAGMIFAKKKTVEVRTWRTDYRGDILICSTAKKIKDTIPSHALCVVRLVDCVPMKKEHIKPSLIHPADYSEDLFAWILDDVRYIKPIPVKGKLSLWNYDGDIEYLQEPETDEEDEKIYHEIYEPLFI